MKFKPLLLIISFVALSVAEAQDYHVRFGFLGNSITIGSGLSNPARDCYPSQLGVLLQEVYGDTCTISNFAVSGRTMLKNGDFPLWDEPDFTRAWNFAPDICFIMLGTNDTKPYNWDDNKQDFFTDYLSMIDTFLVRNPFTKFIVCLPPPAFGVNYDISPEVLTGEVVPLVDSIIKTTGAEKIDFYHPLLDSSGLFPDMIHPSPAGAGVMAKIAFDRIIETDIIHKTGRGHSFVTSLKSNITGELRIGDPATISWTSINGTAAFLNGQPVELNGSASVMPMEDTEYILRVDGPLDSDSLILFQKVYIPELAKIAASASTLTMYPNDTSEIKVRYYDQKNKQMTDSVFNVSYSITEGYGHFVNQADNYVEFVPDSSGKAKVEIAYNGISYTLTFTVKDFGLSSDPRLSRETQIFYPNPFDNKITLKFPFEKPGQAYLSIYDLTGRLIQQESAFLGHPGDYEWVLNTQGYEKGFYLMNLVYPGMSYSFKILKQ